MRSLAGAVWRGIGRLAQPDKALIALTVVVVAHVVVWTIFPTITRNNLDTWGDMAQNFSWGQEWQLGYHQQPPLFAWITALWFEVFPNADWAYFLLSQVNVAIGLIGVWFFVRCFLPPPHALIAVVALCVLPFYTFFSVKYNANAAMLSVWPWAALAFYRSITIRARLWSVLFGVFAALCVLSKYYSFVFLGALLVASLLRPERNAYYRSASPYLSVGVFLIIMAPHLVWVVTGGFQTVHYGVSQTTPDYGLVVRKVGAFAGAQFLYVLPLLATLAVTLGWQSVRQPRSLPLPTADRWTLLAIAFLPFILSLVAGLALSIRLSSVWGIPLWFALGGALVAIAAADLGVTQVQRCLGIVLGFQVAVLVSAPVVGAATDILRPDVWTAPRRELAVEVTRLWRERFGRPLRIVTGFKPYADSVAFYSPDHPSLLIDFDRSASPWVTDARLREEGLAIVCRADDDRCLAEGRRLAEGGEDVHVSLVSTRTWFSEAPPVAFVITLVPLAR